MLNDGDAKGVVSKNETGDLVEHFDSLGRKPFELSDNVIRHFDLKQLKESCLSLAILDGIHVNTNVAHVEDDIDGPDVDECTILALTLDVFENDLLFANLNEVESLVVPRKLKVGAWIKITSNVLIVTDLVLGHSLDREAKDGSAKNEPKEENQGEKIDKECSNASRSCNLSTEDGLNDGVEDRCSRRMRNGCSIGQGQCRWKSVRVFERFGEQWFALFIGIILEGDCDVPGWSGAIFELNTKLCVADWKKIVFAHVCLLV